MTDKTVSLPEQRGHWGFIKNNLRDYGMLLPLFAIILFFQFATDDVLLVFGGLGFALLDGRSIGPFPVTFRNLSSGSIPELLPGAGALHPSSLLIRAVLALGLIYYSAKGRAREQAHGIDVEPYAVFV